MADDLLSSGMKGRDGQTAPPAYRSNESARPHIAAAARAFSGGGSAPGPDIGRDLYQAVARFDPLN